MSFCWHLIYHPQTPSGGKKSHNTMRSLWFEKEEGSVKSLVVRVEGSLHQNCLGVSSRVHIAFLLTIVVTRVTCMFVLLLGRPNVSSGGICFSRDVFLLSVYLFFSPRVLRGSSTDRPETLPHGRNLAEFYNPLQKFEGGGAPPEKLGCHKHEKFRSILYHFRLWSPTSLEPGNI